MTVEGLKITIGSEELKEHILERAKYHRDRAEFYDKQGASLEQGGLSSSLTSNDPVGSLKKSSEQHREKSAYYSFMAGHIIPNEEYILSEGDLSRLELASRYF